jgi:CHAD domain-containing protein/CYTH domain-containing protein
MARDLVLEALFTPGALAHPAAPGIAALLEDRLNSLRAARERLARREDDEALHDFRVALRRLRSLIRVYCDVVEGAFPRRLRRGLRRLARATNASRDIEVKLDWLKTRRDEVRPRDQVGLRWLVGRLTEARHQADQAAHEAIETDLADLTDAVERRIVTLARLGSAAGPTLGQATAGLLRRLAAEYDHHLAQVNAIEDQPEAHEARITGKRVRYLLEPLAGALPPAGTLINEFRLLQDLLGEMHDADVAAHMIAEAIEVAALERGQRVARSVRESGVLDRAALRRERRRDPMPGLITLATAVQRRREDAWRTFARDWMSQRQARLLQPLAAITHSLAKTGAPAVEIERKYLLRGLPDRVTSEVPLELEQGYLPGEQVRERVRRVRSPDGVRCYRTVKLGMGVVRQEFEDLTTEAIFEALWPLTEGHRVTKHRYRIAAGDLVWEIDDFTDRTLVLAEVELPSEDLVPALPDWLAPWVERDVTDDPAYLNSTLAK